MAIKVNGTTVIDDSRNLTNIGTITATSFSGDGSALTGVGGSTTYGAVGTYVWGYMRSSGGIWDGSTYAGSSIQPAGFQVGSNTVAASNEVLYTPTITKGGSAMSGTWRAMGRQLAQAGNRNRFSLFVRIS